MHGSKNKRRLEGTAMTLTKCSMPVLSTGKRLENEKAAHGALAWMVGGPEGKSTAENGLGSNLMAKGLPVADRRVAGLHEARADGSGRRPLSANMPVPLRSKRCELGGLLQRSRRMTAAPTLIRAVAFSFGGVRTHGLIAPALYRSCGLMPCGEPLCSPLPTTRSANPHGVAHLLAEVRGFRQFVVGAGHDQ